MAWSLFSNIFCQKIRLKRCMFNEIVSSSPTEHTEPCWCSLDSLEQDWCAIFTLRKVDPLAQHGFLLFSSKATITSHRDYRASCRQMGLISVLHQFSNLFQWGLDGFDRPSVAKWDRFKTVQKLGSFQGIFLLLYIDNWGVMAEGDRGRLRKPHLYPQYCRNKILF